MLLTQDMHELINMLKCANAAHRENRYCHPGGDSYMKQTGMLVGNFEFNP